MRRNTTYKSGHLDIKLPVKMRARGFRGWKAWKRRWIVLHRLQDIAAGNVIITLDLYHNSCGERQNNFERATIYLEDALHLQRIVSRSHPYAFYVEARDTAVYLAAECETDTQEWMDAICQVFWPRPNLPADSEVVFDAAVTDSAFCTLFGVHGGFCYISLASKDYLLLQCVYTQHVLLEWPLTALARVYVDNPIHLRDRGRLFVIEPRPHTSGWTTPLHFFSLKAQVIVQHIHASMQGLANASKLTLKNTTLHETQTLNRRSTSFYDQPLPMKSKQNRRISDMSHYDTPRPELDSVDVSNILYPPRKRSHSESYLPHAINRSTNSLNINPNSLTALSYNQLDGGTTDEDERLQDSEIATFFSSKDSGFQVDDYAKVKIEKNDQVLLESEHQKVIKPSKSEPLYEELDRLHKDINKLLGIDVDDEIRPPPLPPRCPSSVYPCIPEAQKKDVVRFLGMEDPLARRIVHSQQTSARQMTQGVRKKNLFYFLGVDGIHSSPTPSPFTFDNLKRPEVKVQQSKSTYENNNFFESFCHHFPQTDNTSNQFQLDYDVPVPIGVKYDIYLYDLFAERLMQQIFMEIKCAYRKEIIVKNLDLVTAREGKVIKTTKRVDIMKKIGLVTLFSTALFHSVLYYSWRLDFYKQFCKGKECNGKECTGNKLWKYVLTTRLHGWCRIEPKQLTFLNSL